MKQSDLVLGSLAPEKSNLSLNSGSASALKMSPCYHKGKEILKFISTEFQRLMSHFVHTKLCLPSAREYLSFSQTAISLAYFSLIDFQMIQLVTFHLLKGQQLCLFLAQNHLWSRVLNFIQSSQLFTFCWCTRCLWAIGIVLNTANESDALDQECRMYLASARTEHFRKQTTVCSIFAWKGPFLII